jgi:hypothetical protein
LGPDGPALGRTDRRPALLGVANEAVQGLVGTPHPAAETGVRRAQCRIRYHLDLLSARSGDPPLPPQHRTSDRHAHCYRDARHISYSSDGSSLHAFSPANGHADDLSGPDNANGVSDRYTNRTGHNNGQSDEDYSCRHTDPRPHDRHPERFAYTGPDCLLGRDIGGWRMAQSSDTRSSEGSGMSLASARIG